MDVKLLHLDDESLICRIQEGSHQAFAALVDRHSNRLYRIAYRLQIKKIHELRSLMKRRLAHATIELAKQFSQPERRALSQLLRHFKRHPRHSRLPSDAK